MTKLTAEKCREQYDLLNQWRSQMTELSIRDEFYRQALEIALPLLEQHESKPVAWLNDAYLARGVVDGEAGEDDAGPGYIPVYRHPQNYAPQPTTDTNRQIENDGWIELKAGFMPESVRGDRVQVRYASGETETDYSGVFNWGFGAGDLVIAYRVIENDGREG